MEQETISSEESHFDFIVRVMRENDGFLRKKAENAYTEVIELENDAIDYTISAVKRKEGREDYVKRPMSFFLQSVLMPYSYAIHTDLLTGNLPVCFMELRLMLESLAKSYIADLHPNKNLFFETKLELLEELMGKEKISISKLMKDFGKELGLKYEPLALWGKLSQEWAHPRGIIKGIVDQLVKKSNPPPYALVIPMSYAEDDLDNINKLSKRISQFRDILKSAVNKHREAI
ncbi:MAG: hypothetical protein IBX41_03335 [Methanophagales archaeon]|nr:hypothetical protein [Methanophagales archaeon]